MNRRDSFKTLLVGTLAGASISSSACNDKEKSTNEAITENLYGRIPKELERDQRLKNDQFFNDQELETIAVLCDIILPASNTAGSAGDAGVPAFIEFIAKDLPTHQIPIRGGLMWLNTESNKRFNKVFNVCSSAEQLQIIDDIAYPHLEGENHEMTQGIHFFKQIRNLTITGYYTTKMGIDDLGYVGNRPNVWDGVPDEVLKDHEVEYDPAWLAKCIDQETRNVTAEWDDKGNLVN